MLQLQLHYLIGQWGVQFINRTSLSSWQLVYSLIFPLISSSWQFYFYVTITSPFKKPPLAWQNSSRRFQQWRQPSKSSASLTNLLVQMSERLKKKKNCIVAFCERSPRTRLLLIRRAEDPKWLIASLLSPLLKYTHATPPPQQLNLLRISWWFSRAKALPSIFTTVVYTVVFFYFFQENYKKNNKALLSRCQLRYPNINRCMCSRRAPAVLQACTTVS